MPHLTAARQVDNAPPNYRVAPHTRPYAEVVTVISGTLGNGMGETFEATGELLKPGGPSRSQPSTPIGCVAISHERLFGV